MDALETAINNAIPGDLIVMFYESFDAAFDLVQEFIKEPVQPIPFFLLNMLVFRPLSRLNLYSNYTREAIMEPLAFARISSNAIDIAMGIELIYQTRKGFWMRIMV